MKLKKETKLVRNAGSIRTTVPSSMIDLLDLTEGDKLCWEFDSEKGALITVSPIKKIEAESK